MLDEPISPELALVDGGPTGRWPAEVEAMIDPLDVRHAAAGPSGTPDASSMSVEALLLQAGLITADQLSEVVRDSVLLSRTSAEVLVERGLVAPEALEAVLAKASAPPPVALPFPLPVETLPLHPLVQVEAPLEPVMPSLVAQQSSPVALISTEPTLVAELRSVAAQPPPLEPASPFFPEALQALLTPMATLAAEVPAVETPPLQPVAQPEATVEAAIRSVALEQSLPVVPLPVELELAEPELVAPVMPSTPPMVAERPAEPTPTSVATVFAVLLRLQTGERIAVDKAASFEAAAQVARGHADRFAGATEWPFLAGRCIRPDAVVSVDIERTLEA
jgi:hypothetical protein